MGLDIPTPTVDEAIEATRQHAQGQLGSKGDINSRLFGPAMSSTESFTTFDGKTTFKGNIMCGSEAPVVKVEAFPVGSLNGVGEINMRLSLDVQADGTVDATTTIYNVGGMCSNGYVRDCKPSGSYKDCQYCQWVYEDGNIKERCEKALPGKPQVFGMKGCFCFNRSCGSPIVSSMESALANAAMGLVDVVSRQNNLLAISRSEFSAGDMTLKMMGSKITDCSGVGEASPEVAELQGMYGKFDFPAEDALTNAKNDLNNPYNSINATFGKDPSVILSCQIDASITRDFAYTERPVPLTFGVGFNPDTKECYTFSPTGSCSAMYTVTASLESCVDYVKQNRLYVLCNNYVSSNVFNELTGYSDFNTQSDVGKYSSCASPNAQEQKVSAKCWGGKQDDIFTCNSPSMSLAGKSIENKPFVPQLYQGCDIVRAPKSTCTVLEDRRAKGECTLTTELVDGVFTQKDGAVTGLVPAGSCRTFEGQQRNLSFCEPFWKKERIYKCKATAVPMDFSSAKERANHIGNNIGYNKDTGAWNAQPDLVIGEDGSKNYTVYDLGLHFQESNEQCIPACRVKTKGIATDSKGAAALSSVGIAPEILKTCTQGSDKTWNCPLDADETAVTGCLCTDMGAFGQGVAAMQVISKASQDMICSSGKDVGVCENPDGPPKPRVVCITGMTSNDISQIDPKGIKDCNPKAWIGTGVNPQKHEISATDDYHCFARVPALPEDDHFLNDIGPLIPESKWFDPVDQWARPLMLQTLSKDPDFIPDPANENCPCDRDKSTTDENGWTTKCSWTTTLSVANVNRRDVLGLNPTSDEPFGKIEYIFSAEGVWGGTTSAACVKAEPAYVEVSPLVGTCTTVPKSGTCTGVSTPWYTTLTTSNGGCRNSSIIHKATDSGCTYVYSSCSQSEPGNGITSTVFISLTGPHGNYDCGKSQNAGMNLYYNYGGCFPDYPIASTEFGGSAAAAYNACASGPAYKCSTNGTTYPNIGACNNACTAPPTHKCSLTGTEYISASECANNCKQRQYRCSLTGLVTTNPATCPTWRCPVTGANFNDQTSCNDRCITNVACNASSSYKFEAAIKNPGSNSYTQELRAVAPTSRSIGTAAYTHEDTILSQCVDRYLNPHMAFNDPTTGARFEVSLIDELIFQHSVQRGEARQDPVSFLLPLFPAVYSPTFTSSDGAETKLRPLPMYMNKQTSATWADDNGVRLGRFSIDAKNLIPHVYYYECPTGNIVKSDTNNCGAIDPFGGVDWTVKGNHCFQNRCDINANLEESNVYGNCGMVEDMEWK